MRNLVPSGQTVSPVSARKHCCAVNPSPTTAPSSTGVELKQRSHINARAQAAGDAPDFSQRIRAGLPMPPPASR